MNTTYKNTLKTLNSRSHLHFAMAAFGILAILAALFWLAFGQYFGPVFNAFALQDLSAQTTKLYLIVRGVDELDTVLVVDPASGKVKSTIEAGYNTEVTLTASKATLYVFNDPLTPDKQGKGILSAIDTQTGTVLWKLGLPGWPFAALAADSAWLSADERYLYLQATPDGLDFHIYIIDTQTRTLVNDFELALPYPSNQFFPRIWKFPQAEALLVVAKDQLFRFDLRTGTAEPALRLSAFANASRIPLSFSKGFLVQDGVLAPDGRTLWLAIASQEILSVKLDTQPFTVQRRLSLPDGWLFGGRGLVAVNPKEQALYISVTPSNTPILNGLEAEEIWTFDTITGAQRARLRLQDQIARFTNRPASNVDQTTYGLTLVQDGATVYVLSPQGLLGMNQDPSGRLNANWINLGDQLSANFGYDIIP